MRYLGRVLTRTQTLAGPSPHHTFPIDERQAFLSHFESLKNMRKPCEHNMKEHGKVIVLGRGVLVGIRSVCGVFIAGRRRSAFACAVFFPSSCLRVSGRKGRGGEGSRHLRRRGELAQGSFRGCSPPPSSPRTRKPIYPTQSFSCVSLSFLSLFSPFAFVEFQTRQPSIDEQSYLKRVSPSIRPFDSVLTPSLLPSPTC